MKPHRLTLTNHLVLKYGLHDKMEIFQPRRATDDEILEFHAADYVDFLKRYGLSFDIYIHVYVCNIRWRG